jgi:hypothetical protein
MSPNICLGRFAGRISPAWVLAQCGVYTLWGMAASVRLVGMLRRWPVAVKSWLPARVLRTELARQADAQRVAVADQTDKRRTEYAEMLASAVAEREKLLDLVKRATVRSGLLERLLALIWPNRFGSYRVSGWWISG